MWRRCCRQKALFLTYSSPPGSASLGDSDWSCIPPLSHFLPGTDTICEKALPGGNSTPRRNLTWFRSLSSVICSSKIKDLGKRVKRRSECVEPVTHRLSPFRKPEKRCCLPYSLWEEQTCLASPGSHVTDESTVTQAELSGSHLPWLCRQGRTQVCGKLGIMADSSVK